MTQTNTTQSFTIVDPMSLDGDPFEVAERALRQSAALAKILHGTLKGARAMAQNAEMERQLFATGECDAAAFEGSAQARRIDEIARGLSGAERSLESLAKAAAYNPRKPPRV